MEVLSQTDQTRRENGQQHTGVYIEIHNLTMAYGDFIIQRDLNFTISRGDVFIIMGGSGCGKSTLMKHLIGLKPPASGDIIIDGMNYWKAQPREQEALKQRFGVMFQAGALWSSLTLAENIALPLGEYTKLSDKQIAEVVSLKLALVGLSGFEEFYPSQISGGMRKRASLARAIALDPEIVFFDEPSAGLDPISSRRLDNLILELSNSLRMTVVIVTHELASIFAIGNNSVFLDADTKTMLTTGDPNILRNDTSNPKVKNFLNRGE
ncbi:ATP-binding cassette domain-containing protein [uncultured Nitrosomonas sp.]|uniref:ABC transporter ATP-binding protein n=1 Tax=uncultured Nitrosomonas sp. TaxID=156424 RepID=UPI0025E248BC|nr:ATP-binding cassette domain-containing protein [uncultured Nitrosomonas sp.]